MVPVSIWVPFVVPEEPELPDEPELMDDEPMDEELPVLLLVLLMLLLEPGNSELLPPLLLPPLGNRELVLRLMGADELPVPPLWAPPILPDDPPC